MSNLGGLVRVEILILALVVCLPLLLVGAGCGTRAQDAESTTGRAETAEVRVATYNLEDVRTENLEDPDTPRLKRFAATIQRFGPDVLLLNEIAYDGPGAPGYEEGDQPGQNARRFAENFLAVSQGEGLEPIRYRTFMAPSNTGVASGFDLDNSGEAVTDFPQPPPEEQTEAGRAYGNDAFGFGTFPGQYAMALLAREDIEILEEDVRTFQKFLWRDMPGALLPKDPETGEPFYSEEELSEFRLSSKSHWDVPVRLPNGAVLHLLASHPTPPSFDGPEQRNARRNHDEIRFWADYINDEDYIVDDSGGRGGLSGDASSFVVLGDLNADPNEGDSVGDPIGRFLLNHERINGDFVPRAREPDPELDPDDTAMFGLRVDYVLPSEGLRIRDGGVFGHGTLFSGEPPSDHFPVWLNLSVPAG